MPELPEIQNLVLQLKKSLEGLAIRRIEIHDEAVLQNPAKEFEKKLPGRKIVQIGRIGKYIRIELSEAMTLWFHLGMTGQLFLSRSAGRSSADWSSGGRPLGHPAPRGRRGGETFLPHTHFILHLSDSNHLLYRDARKFGRIALTPQKEDQFPEGVRRLGPEPGAWDSENFASFCKARKARIKSLLLNQRFMAGLGNIYADESLHRAGIHPLKRSCEVPRQRLFRLHEAIGEVLGEAIRLGGSSIDDFIHLDGSRGRFQEFHRVYGRGGESCRACGFRIRRIKIAGRTSSYCPHCQPYKPLPQPIGA